MNPVLRFLCLIVILIPALERNPAHGAPGIPGDETVSITRLGTGFLTWESNRSGDWRIWTCYLDGSGLRQLSPDEKDRDHFAAHISPDGGSIVYISYPKGLNGYGGDFKKGQSTAMHLVKPDGSGDRVLIPDARTLSSGHRGAIWFSDREVVYCDPAGVAWLWDVETGKKQQVTTGGRYLINATRTIAFRGGTVFPSYDPKTQKIGSFKAFSGCEPYVTHDGKWGFWMSNGGGPVNRIHLASGNTSPILDKADTRLPGDRNYVYFPMVSRCGNLFTFAASPRQHDHHTSDYDVFVAPINPETLELTDQPVRYTFDPGTDRYPDVHLDRTSLEFLAGEAPFEADFGKSFAEAVAKDSKAKGLPSKDWSWDYGDGAKGASVLHVYEKPGRYLVGVSQQGRIFRGQVEVKPAVAPRVLAVLVEGDKRIKVTFDESVDAGKLKVRLDPGPAIAGHSLDGDGRSLVLDLKDPLEKSAVLELEGITDRAGRPNLLEPQKLEVGLRSWPTDDRGLAFLFETNDQRNEFRNAAGEVVSDGVERKGRARFDRAHALLLDGGFGRATEAEERLLAACLDSNALSIEATLTSAPGRQTGPARIVSFSSGTGSRNFTLGQTGEQLVLRLRTPLTGVGGTNPEVVLGSIEPGRTHHIAVTYRPGTMIFYLDGREVKKTAEVGGDFSNWSPQQLLLGDEKDGGRHWAGTLEGIALYSRVLPADEIARNARQYAAVIAARPPVESVQVKARLVGISKFPTLEEISPYREGLVTAKYEVSQVIRGQLKEHHLLVAHWALLDGEAQSIRELKLGAEITLLIEPLEANRQLNAFYRRDDFEEGDDLIAPRWFAIE